MTAGRNKNSRSRMRKRQRAEKAEAKRLKLRERRKLRNEGSKVARKWKRKFAMQLAANTNENEGAKA